MFIAVDSNNNRIHIDDISSGQECFCPACGSLLSNKNHGRIRRHHFSHRKDSPCSDEWYNDYESSEWHDEWQSLFPAENQEIFIDNGSEKHRADVVIGRSVIEFQSSRFPEAINIKNHFYVEAGYRVVWLFNCVDKYYDGNISIRNNILHWSRMPAIFDDADIRLGLTEIYLQIKDKGEDRIIKIAPKAVAGDNKLNIAVVYGRGEFLEHIGLVNGQCKPPFIRDEAYNAEFNGFAEKYGITLNKQQQSAVQAVDGDNLLFAVPGSGKTTVLIARLGYMVMCRNIAPENILAITFTRAAADEMRSRFADKFGADYAKRIEFGDIHQLARKIIIRFMVCVRKSYPNDAAASKAVTDMTIREEDKKKILCQLMKSSKNEYVEEANVVQASSDITFIKNYYIKGDTVDYGLCTTPNLEKIIEKYEEVLKKEHKMDFDFMLCYAYDILKKNESILSYFQDRYRYISVDEAQDTSKVQHEMIKLLAGKYNNIFMVGDEDQSIYGFRGAEPTVLTEFNEQYKDPFILFMDSNFRSTKEIVDASAAFVKNSKERTNKNIKSVRGSGEKVERINVADRSEQYRSLVERLSNCTEDTAVLYRDNECGVALADMLIRKGIPFRFIKESGTFFISPVLKDIKAFIMLVLDPYDTESFTRICYKCGCYFNKTDVSAVVERAMKQHITIVDSISVQDGMLERNYGKGKEFVKVVKESANSKTTDIITAFLDLGYDENIKGKFEDRVEVITILAESEPDPKQFLNRLEVLQGGIKNSSSDGACIKLSTIHSSKGLEFDTVYLIDVFDGMLPKYSQYASNEKLYQEERRLFYVAMTRAKNKLHIYAIKDKRTPFVNEIFPERDYSQVDVEICDNMTPKQIEHKLYNIITRNPLDDIADADTVGIPEANSKQGVCDIGVIIIHKTYGRGTIISFEEKLGGSGRIAKVQYDNGQTSSLEFEIALRYGVITFET